MLIEVFGVRLKMAQSTSPVPGKLAACVIAADQKVWADLFLWDPLSQVIQFDEEALDHLLQGALRSHSPWVSGVLTVTDFAISVVKSIRRLFGGSYGGSLGYGQMGGITAMASAFAFILVSILAAFIVAPLAILAGVLRYKINSDINKEKPRVLEQATGFFQALSVG